VDLMIERLMKLSAHSRARLGLAAAIGSRFELDRLALVSGEEPPAIDRALATRTSGTGARTIEQLELSSRATQSSQAEGDSGRPARCGRAWGARALGERAVMKYVLAGGRSRGDHGR
jgi:hypothetical protein